MKTKTKRAFNSNFSELGFKKGDRVICTAVSNRIYKKEEIVETPAFLPGLIYTIMEDGITYSVHPITKEKTKIDGVGGNWRKATDIDEWMFKYHQPWYSSLLLMREPTEGEEVV